MSDAGTPGISDPGFLLARACVDAGIPFEVLPGATAFVPALVKVVLHFISFDLKDFYHKERPPNTYFGFGRQS